MKQVYVLLSRTDTVPSKMIHVFTRGNYTHSSLALTPDTSMFHSYARRKLNNFFVAGLMIEDVHTHVFARFPECHCAVYEIDVSDESYEKIKEYVEFLHSNYDRSTYNFLGAGLMRLGIIWRRKYRFTCSQFVARSLSNAEEIKLPKDPYLMLPNDFPKIEGARMIYSGKIKNCNFDGASVNGA